MVTLLLVDLAVILVLAAAFGALARRLGQPAVLGEILAGLLLGPTLAHGSLSTLLFPTEARPSLTALADVGVALFMFLVGLEFDVAALRGHGRTTVDVAFASLLLPFASGAALALALAPHRLALVLFLGASMSVTAFPVLARILADRGMADTAVGRLALGCAAIGDVVAWSLLAVVVTVVTGQAQWRVALLVPYAALMLTAGRRLLRVVVPRLGLPAILVGLLASAAFTEWIGLHMVFGAFLIGIVVPRDVGDDARDALRRMAGLLLPVYFVVAGLGVDLSGLGLAGLAELAAILLVAVGGKTIGAFVAARMHGIDTRTAAVLAALMNTRGLTELVFLSVGRGLGILDTRSYSLLVVMAVLTTAMTGPLLTLLYRREIAVA